MQVSWKWRCLLAAFSLLSMSSHVSADMIRLSTQGDILGNVFVAQYEAGGGIRVSASDQFGEGSPVGADFWTATDNTGVRLDTALGTSEASQTWSAGPNRFQSEARTTAYGEGIGTDFVQADSTAIYLSIFRLTSPFDYIWNSVVDSVGHSIGPRSVAQAILATPTERLIESFSGLGAVAFTQSGTLAPGDYVIIGHSHTTALAGPFFGHTFSSEGSNSFSIDLSLTPSAPIPEPATLMLFGTGAASLWWRRKRRI